VGKIITIHDVPPIPDKKTEDNFEGLSGSCPTLVRCEPIEPLEDRLDVILSPKLLYEIFCVALVKCHAGHWQDKRTKSSLLYLLGRKSEGRE